MATRRTAAATTARKTTTRKATTKPAAKSEPVATKGLATKRAIDFSNVKEPGNYNPRHKPEGDYKATVSKVEDSESKAGNPMWIFTFTLTSDARATYPYYCVLDENSAWKIRNLLMACGLNVPKKRMNVDPNKIVGRELGVSLEDDEYEGKMRSKVQATFPADELDGDEPDDDGSDDVDLDDDDDADVDDDDDAADDDDDDLDDVDLDEL